MLALSVPMASSRGGLRVEHDARRLLVSFYASAWLVLLKMDKYAHIAFSTGTLLKVRMTSDSSLYRLECCTR